MTSAGRHVLAAALLLSALFCPAAELTELPEVLATFEGSPIRRGELAPEIAARLAELAPEADREAVRRLVRRGVDDAICRRLLDAELKKHGLAPSAKLAEQYLAAQLGMVPQDARENLERELAPRLKSPDFQLKAAVHLYLERRFSPLALSVSPAEIERYYEINRQRYRLPERWNVGVIMIDRRRADAADIAAAARARLLQGENFDRVARELDPEGGGDRLSPEAMRELFAGELSRLSPGDVSRVISSPDAYYILRLRSRDPGGEIPLEVAAPYIRLEVSAAKDSLALNRVLVELFKASHIEYSPFLQPGGGVPPESGAKNE